MYEVVEGVHYLVDYYTLLGLSHDATKDAIAAAIRDGIKGYHPDLVARAAPEIQDEAKRVTRLLVKARNLLVEDSQKKEAYDHQLATWQGPISTNGYAVIDLTAEYHSFGTMLAEDAEAQRRDVAAFEEKALAMSGHDPYMLELAEKMYEEDPSEEKRAAYERMLLKLSSYLHIAEELRWQLAGYNRKVAPTASLQYVDAVRGELASLRDEVKPQLAEALSLHGGELRMLAARCGEQALDEDTLDDSSLALAHLESLVNERLVAVEPLILEAAEKRVDVADKLLEVLKYDYRPDQPVRYPVLYLHFRFEKSEHWFCIKKIGDTYQVMEGYRQEEMEKLKETEYALKMIREGCNVAYYTHKDDLNPRDEFDQIITDHFAGL